MDLVFIITLLGIAQGFFIGVLLFTRKSGNKRANKILGILFFVFSVSLGYYLFYSTNLFLKYPHLLRTTFPSTFLFGPLMYLYVKVQIEKSVSLSLHSRESWKIYLHFLPFILIVAANIPFYMKSSEEKLHYFLNPVIIKNNIELVQSILQVIQTTVYIIVIKIVIQKHSQKIKNLVSTVEKVNLQWLSVCMNYFITIFFLITAHLILLYVGVDLSSIYHITIPIIVVVFIYVLGFLGLRQQEIVFYSDDDESGKKYEKSTLTTEKSEEYLSRLLEIMETGKPFLEVDLTLLKLAERLGISAHHLSQVINEKLNQNFFDFVNKYRIEEAKRMLLDPAKNYLTIFAIAVEAGFNSKSAFNICFKKYTHTTPSEFKKKYFSSNQIAA